MIVNGHFAGAVALVNDLQFEQLSITKSHSVLGKAINVMDPDVVHLLPRDDEHAMQVQLLQRQSQSYYELSLLVRAVQALEKWRRTEDEYVRCVSPRLAAQNVPLTFSSRVPRPSSVPAKVKAAFEDTRTAIEPLLTGILQDAKDGTTPLGPCAFPSATPH